MIELTRFDGSRFYVNAELIEFIETTPDTVVSLLDHKKLLVRETAEDVVDRVIAYRLRAGAGSPAVITALQRWFLARDDQDLRAKLRLVNDEEAR